MRTLRIEPTFASFRDAARVALARDLAPHSVHFADKSAGRQQSFDLDEELALPVGFAGGDGASVPRSFLELGQRVALHRSADVWDALYRALYRLTHGEPRLLEVATDPDVRTLALFDAAVRRDIHKMHAFVRFRRAVAKDGEEVWVSFYEPDHRIAERAASFFVDRFGGARFVLATPDVTVSWDKTRTHLGPGAPDESTARRAFEEDRAHEDGVADLFCAYYDNIFNPARLNIKAMRAEMPERFWKHLPEAQSVTRLVREASARQQSMVSPRSLEPTAAPPVGASLLELRHAASECDVCPHAACATQTVFGAGPQNARLMLVGEQPGDEEDVSGLPFQGPAGQLLRELLAEAGVDASELYITNAVKHFTFEQRGKRRLHMRPHQRAVTACRPWLDAELAAVKPDVIVCLGATAAQSFLGPGFRVTQALGKWLPQPWSKAFLVTYHPSAILRMESAEARSAARAQLMSDLRRARSAVDT